MWSKSMSIEYRLTEKIPAEDFLDGRLERHGVIHTMQDRRIFNAIGPSRYGRPVIYRPTEECDFGGFYVLVEKPPTGFSCRDCSRSR